MMFYGNKNTTTENVGFAKGHNKNLAKSPLKDYRYFLLLNPDTWFKEDTIGKMVKFMDENEGVGIVAPKIIDVSSNLLLHNGDKFPSFWYGLAEISGVNLLFRSNPLIRKRTRSSWGRDTTEEVDSVGGACMLIRSSLIDKIGMLDENFFMYWEDTDYCKRAKEVGSAVYFLDTTSIYHSCGGSNSPRYVKYKYHRESLLYYYLKHYGKCTYYLFKLFDKMASVLRIYLSR